MGTQTKDKSKAFTAKTTNCLMIELDNFLKRPWILGVNACVCKNVFIRNDGEGSVLLNICTTEHVSPLLVL